MPTIHFLSYNYFAYFNQGDINSLPLWYFNSFFKNYNISVANLFNLPKKSISPSDIVIIGGGGLIDDNKIWNTVINEVNSLCKNVILWGAGINTTIKDGKIIHKNPNIDFSKFRLMGIRDYDNPLKIPYTPCCSCMIPYFYKNSKSTQKIVQMIRPTEKYNHLINNKFPNFTHFNNLEAIFDYILSAEIILTTSYHCAYWAILMKKKVIIPTSQLNGSKYCFYKYKPYFLDDSKFKDIDIINNIISRIEIYPEALIDQRNEVLTFFEKVKMIIYDVIGDDFIKTDENNFTKLMFSLSEHRSAIISLNDRIKKIEESLEHNEKK